MSENDTAGKLAAGGETAAAEPETVSGTDGTEPAGGTVALKPASEEEVREALYDVVDPELGIDVVNLGLIYGIHIDDANIATLDMTLTSAACPLTDVIEDQAKAATDGIVNELKINWVWMPPWGPDKITDDGREQLRALGFNV
ncbi:metal-sulfur cluster assembly factor [Streptomyces lavendulocolor]|jgi:metal-sulfur cluster biosynthetic enzyme|uniref:metal-sulfur cluster assembly factor n=1 Tax=Streptomyces lavendulocolor TaxID=67316 RepID=UPI00267AAEB5